MTTKLRKLAEHLGNSGSLQEAALKAGYAPSTARSQDSITSRKGFKEILNEYLPLEKAYAVTNDALDAEKLGADGNIPDHAIRLKATDQVYKLHNVLQPDQTHVGDNITVNIQAYGDTDNFRTPGLATTFRDSEQQSSIQDPQLAPEST